MNENEMMEKFKKEAKFRYFSIQNALRQFVADPDTMKELEDFYGYACHLNEKCISLEKSLRQSVALIEEMRTKADPEQNRFKQ